MLRKQNAFVGNSAPSPASRTPGILVLLLGVGACEAHVARPPVPEPSKPVPCHVATREDVAAGIPRGLTVCGAVSSGNYSYTTAGACTCVQVFENHVQQAPRCTPCASYLPPPPPHGPAVGADPEEISIVYATPPDGCLAAPPLRRDSVPQLFRTAKELPRYADPCEFRVDDVPDADSDFQLVVVPLEGRTIAGFSVHEGVLTVSFEAVECAGGERVATVPSPAKAPVPNGRPFFKVPRSIKKVVLAPPVHRACPPAMLAPGGGARAE